MPVRYRSGTKVGESGNHPSAREGPRSAGREAGLSGLSGKYQPFASLGEGGMAQVFLAVARGPQGFNKLVVLKRMRAQLAQDEGLVTMFVDEARLAARLNHPNVVHTYEIGEYKGLYFIAMEYLDGQPLNRILAEVHRVGREVRPAVWMRVVGDALLGLHYAHTLKDYDGTPLDIVHRDVSPHNVFVTYGGQAKVVDFGIAKAILSRTQTDAGSLKGKIAYMSPEQARGDRLDRRSDVFAMGIVLWEALAGRKLFGHELAGTTLHKLLNSNAPRLSTVLGDAKVDPELDELVARALARDADDRFQSAQEMREALEDWMRTRGEIVRQDEVGDVVSDLFDGVRTESQRQIQAHMAAITADPGSSGSLDAVSGLATWDSGPTALPALHVAAGGSGSAMVRQATRDPAMVARQRRRVTLAVVITLALAVVATAVILPGLVRRNGARASGATTAAPVPPQASVADGLPAALAPDVPAAAVTSVAPSAPAVVAIVPAATASAQLSARVATVVTKPAATARAPAAASSIVLPEPGFLTFDSYPWTRVSEDGRILGDTPLVRRSLPAGVHVLTLDNAEQGIHQTYSVTISSGEMVSRRLGLK
jgi:eukaryotic-like serine/threonine-protein kinase